MLALALAESAQQVSILSQSSMLCTPQSPPSSQDVSHFQDSSQTPFETLSEEEPATGGSLPPSPKGPTSTVAPASMCPITSSPTMEQQPLDLPTTVIKLPEDTTCSTQTQSDPTPSDLSQCPASPILASPARKEPEHQIPIQTNSSSNTPVSNPSGSCRDSDALSQPEASLISFIFWGQCLIYIYINVWGVLDG